MRHLLSILAAVAALLSPLAVQAAEPARFTVEVRGQGPDVILIPGLASSRDVWADTARRLEGRYRLHLVQVDGFAGSPAGLNATGPVVGPLADAIVAYIKAEGLTAPAVIGHSLGGFTALTIADRYPEAVGRIMIVDALPFFSVLVSPTATAEAIAPQAAGLRDMMVAQPAETFAAQQERGTAALVKSPQGRKDVLAWSIASDRKVMAQGMYDVMTTDLRGDLASIATPVTVVYARDDSMGPMASFVEPLYAQNYAALPNKTLVRVDGALHFVMLDQPEAFAAAVDSFLK